MDEGTIEKQKDFYGVSEDDLMLDWSYVDFDDDVIKGDLDHSDLYPGMPRKSVIVVQVFTLDANALNHDGKTRF